MAGIDTTSPHYKGKYASIYEVNVDFPNGGSAGDYVDIQGFAHYWNPDRNNWCVNEERDEYWDELLAGAVTGLDRLNKALAEETSERIAADGILSKAIENVNKAIQESSKKITDETAAREAAVAELQGKISEETTARADANIQLWEGIREESKERSGNDERHDQAIENLINKLDGLKAEDIGAAPIEGGMIPEKYLQKDVLEFSGYKNDMALEPSGLKSYDPQAIYYTGSSFVAQDSNGRYYDNWESNKKYKSAANYGIYDDNDGVEPVANKIYIATNEDKTYRWNGEELKPLSDKGGGGTELSSLETRLTVLESKLKQIFSSDRTVIEAGVATSVKLTGTLDSEITSIDESIKADSITIKVPNKETATGKGIKSFAQTYSLTLADNKTIVATMEIEYLKSKLPMQSLTIYGRHKIYYGFGLNASSVLGSTTRYKLSTSAKTTYTDTSEIDGLSQFFICVPDNVTLPTSFKDDQGYGATLTKDAAKVSFNGTNYTIFHTDGAGYPKRTKITLIGG